MATSKSKSSVKKETKTKTTGTVKKSPTASKTGRSRKVATISSTPGEDDIRAKAQEIYNDRLTRGEHGTPESDWLKAERLLKG